MDSWSRKIPHASKELSRVPHRVRLGQLLKPERPRACAPQQASHRDEKPTTTESLCTATRKSPCIATKTYPGTAQVVQWLRLQAPSAGDLGLIPGQGARSHVPQLRVRMLQLKMSCMPHLRPGATTYNFKKEKASKARLPPALGLQ